MRAERHLVIFARFPVAGAGKRRLAAGIGAVQAVRFQRVRLAHLLGTLGNDPRWRTWLAITPDRSGPWPRHVGALPQGHGDLGQRLARVTKALPCGRIVIIGGDIPGIAPADVAEAFRRLAGTDAVFGPAGDGGYWLIGLRHAPRLRLPFDNVRWSSAHALADTERALGPARIGTLRQLEDVDDVTSLAHHPHWPRRIRKPRDRR